jgi:hypothetical protein
LRYMEAPASLAEGAMLGNRAEITQVSQFHDAIYLRSKDIGLSDGGSRK